MFANEGKDGAFVAEEDEGGFFQRSQAVLGAEAMRALARTKVAVFGLGGVGGWCAEALARTGVGMMLVVDADRVAPSNVNRQLVATPDTVGEFKASVLRRRLMAVNPLIEVEERCEFYDAATAATFGIEECDVVVDAIDSLDSKAMLIRHALSAPGVGLGARAVQKHHGCSATTDDQGKCNCGSRETRSDPHAESVGT
jgi:tRNA A37 threonylcarbamoyladenosine dehydratase